MASASSAFRSVNMSNTKQIQSMLRTGESRLKRSTTKNSKNTTVLEKKLLDTQEVIYSVAQLAKELGTTPAAIRKRIARGFIPAHREGRQLYILKSEYVSCLRDR